MSGVRFPSQLKFDSDARRKMLEGMNIVAEAVASTLGPQGRNVAINQPSGPPHVVHDGVTVAKRVELFDHFKDMGANLLKEAAIKTNEVAGDGTTTATILGRALVTRGIESIEAGTNPMTIKREMEAALVLLLKELKKMSKKIANEEEKEQIATISAADPVIGKLVAEAIKKTGDEGIIRVEEGEVVETMVEYKSGMEIDRGYLSPYFITDQGRVEAIIENADILITDIKMNREYELLPFLQKYLKAKRNNLVIIGEVLEQAMATLVVNHLKGSLRVVAIQPPAFGGRQIDELEDIAVLTGGTAIMKDSGRKLDSVELSELGSAGKVVSDRDKTIIFDGGGDKNAVEARVEELRAQVGVANTDYDKEVKKQRIANLGGSVAIIHVGGTTEIELRERKERVIDAVNATQAAIDEGVVAGGEITLLTLSQQDWWPETVGAGILREAIKKPFQRIIENAGYDYAEVWGKISPLKYPYGIDVIDGKKKDLIKAGIIDPVKVVRSALENAVSVATMAFTTNVLISEPYEQIKTTDKIKE